MEPWRRRHWRIKYGSEAVASELRSERHLQLSPKSKSINKFLHLRNLPIALFIAFLALSVQLHSTSFILSRNPLQLPFSKLG